MSFYKTLREFVFGWRRTIAYMPPRTTDAPYIDDAKIIIRFKTARQRYYFEHAIMMERDNTGFQLTDMRDMNFSKFNLMGVRFELEDEEQWRSIPEPKARLVKENSQSFCVDWAIALGGGNSFLVDREVLMLYAQRLATSTLKSSELKQAISTFGLIKLEGTQAKNLRLCFIGEIVDPGSRSSTPKN